MKDSTTQRESDFANGVEPCYNFDRSCTAQAVIHPDQLNLHNVPKNLPVPSDHRAEVESTLRALPYGAEYIKVT